MARDIALTTIDNIWDPFDQFIEWYRCDELELKHHTSGLLADLYYPSEGLSDADNFAERERAIDDFVKHQEYHFLPGSDIPQKIWYKVERDIPDE